MTKQFKIKMNETLRGTRDGFTTELFKKGEYYTVNESLYNSFKNMGACEEINIAEKVIKKISPVKENKADKPVKGVK